MSMTKRILCCRGKVIPYLSNNICGRFYFVNKSAYLAYFQFAFCKVTLKHTFLSTRTAEEFVQLFCCSASCFCFCYFLVEFIFYQPYRSKLFQCKYGITLIGFYYSLLKVQVAARLGSTNKPAAYLHTFCT